jgi:integrase
MEDKEYAAYSKAEFRKTLSKMYRAFYDEREKIRFISTDPKKKNLSKLKAEELPKPKHIKEMVRNARNSRDEALIMALWDTGGRIEAVLNLKWKNFNPGENSYIRFTERNKTMLRKIPVAESVPSLKKWSDEHPNPDTEEYIFTKYEGNKATKHAGLEPVKYSTVYSMLKRVRKETDLPEKVKTNPHAFRKARATFLAASGMNVNMLAKFMGWSDIKTAEKYVSLAQDQLTSSFKEAVGLEGDKESQGLEMDNEELKPGRCRSCNAVVSAAWSHCHNCGDTIQGDNLLSLLEERNGRDVLEKADQEELEEALQKLEKLQDQGLI